MAHICELEALPVIGRLPFNWSKRVGPEVQVSEERDARNDVILSRQYDFTVGELTGLLARRIGEAEVMIAIFGESTYVEIDRIAGKQINRDPRTRGRLKFFN